MVLTNVSAFVGADQEAVVIEGNGVSFFVPKPYPASHVLAAPVTVYFNAGHTPTVSIHIQDSSQHTPLIVTLVGYVVPDR